LTDAEGYGDSTTLLRLAGNGSSWDEQNDGREHNDNCEYRDLSESGFHLFLLFAVRLSEKCSAGLRQEFTQSSASVAMATKRPRKGFWSDLQGCAMP
jgi:hypothetical protein